MKDASSKRIFLALLVMASVGCATQQHVPQTTIVAIPATVSAQPVYRQPVTDKAYTKFNPRTGKIFPANYDYDPDSGEVLKPIQ